jgi:uncharacterized membrane protein
MAHQEATSVVPLPLAAVYERLRDVESWPMFIEGLELVTKTAHQRYRMVVRSGRTAREVSAAVLDHPKEHRFSWRSLGGPRYDGEIRLSAIDDRLTRIKLTFTADPVGFMAGISEMFGTSNDTAQIDMRRLEEHLGSEGRAVG